MPPVKRATGYGMEVEMSDSNPSGLPEKPSLEQLRKQAKELKASGAQPTLSAAQHGLARDYGFESWPRLKQFVELAELRQAIVAGDKTKFESLLASNPKLVRETFEQGDTPLHLAAEFNEPAMIEALVKAGARFDAKYAHSAHTALSWAVTTWSFEAGMKLVEMGCKPDLFCASGLGLMEKVKAFWPDGELVENPSQTGSSRTDENWQPLPRPPASAQEQVSDALYIACRANRLDVAKWLLEHGADPNFRGFIGATCLHWAEFSANPELSALVRQHGGLDELRDFEFKATPGQFPAMIYAGWGFKKQLWELLQKHPAQTQIMTPAGTPLHAAAASGQKDSAIILVHVGADKSALNPQGETPAQVAERRGHPELVEVLR